MAAATPRPSPTAPVLTTEGVVTGLKSNGFFMQQDAATQPPRLDGILSHEQRAAAGAAIGNKVRVTGTLSDSCPTPTSTRTR